MKKLFLTALAVALVACFFALGVSAAGSATDEFGTAEALEGIPVDLTDTTSRVVLKGSDGLFRTFPSAYIYFKTGAGNWSWRGEAKCTFEYINAALGLTEDNAYTIDSVIRIEVPNDLKYLEGYSGKANLKEMYFSPSSEMTNLRPMGGGSGLEKITMPPKQTSYASYMFHTATKLTTINFYENENLKALPTEMFKGCTSLEEFTFPSSVTSMGSSFFSGCTNLKSVTLSPGITSIGTSFSGLANLEYVNTENITSYSNKAFQGCTKLDGIVLNEAVTYIPNDFCKDCSSLTSIVIPAGVTEVRGYAFSGCSKLASVTNNSTVLKDIQANAFSSCPITEFKNTDALVRLGDYAFIGAKFTSIDLPNTITSLGQGVFQNCTNLTFVRIPELVTQVPHDFLKGTQNSKITIVVPRGCTSIYSQYSLNNSGIQEIIFTGDENSEFIASVTEKASGWLSKITYGDHCEYYYGGHNMSAEAEMQLTSYFEVIKFASVCTNAGCDHAGYIEDMTIGSIFVNYGYSMTETEIGGKLSMSQFFGVNKGSLTKYTEVTGNAFEYGFVVSSNADPMNEANSGLIAEGKTHITDQSKFAHDYFAVTVVGFTDATVDKGLTFCVYVKDGDSISYLDNGETVETVNMKSYNDVKALLENNNTEVTE